MNAEVYKILNDADNVTWQGRFPKRFEYLIKDNFKVLKKIINESTSDLYKDIWKHISETYVKYILGKNPFKYIVFVFPMYSFSPDLFSPSSYYVADLVKAMSEYAKSFDLKCYKKANGYFDVYNEELLFQMLNLDGITYELGTYKNSVNKYLKLKVSKEKLKEHIKKANELCKWVNRDGEDEEKRHVLLRSLNNQEVL